MIHRPDTKILNQRRRARQGKPIGRAIPATVRRRANGKDIVRRDGTRVRKPDNHAFPVMSMTEFSRRRVLRHVPGVHQCVFGSGLGPADVDLAGTAVTVAASGAGWFQAGARVVRLVWLFEG